MNVTDFDMWDAQLAQSFTMIIRRMMINTKPSKKDRIEIYDRSCRFIGLAWLVKFDGNVPIFKCFSEDGNKLCRGDEYMWAINEEISNIRKETLLGIPPSI